MQISELELEEKSKVSRREKTDNSMKIVDEFSIKAGLAERENSQFATTPKNSD